jgi:hypothetical protein
MKAILVDFAKQNQPKWPSFKIFLGGVSRQGSFETASFSKRGAALWRIITQLTAH